MYYGKVRMSERQRAEIRKGLDLFKRAKSDGDVKRTRMVFRLLLSLTTRINSPYRREFYPKCGVNCNSW